jgi:thioredoxin reductase/SAM-dependent methyltransferase
MSDHQPRTIERHCDVAVIGGSAAGLAAALQLGRQRRSVIVIDAGEPRNAPAAHMHSYLGFDGVAPSEFNTTAREEVRRYGVEVLDGRVVEVARIGEDGFRLALVGGHSVVARRVLAASGIVDELPDIDGLVEHWGRDVIHCPFCHGYEVRDQRIVQIISHPLGLHTAVLLRQLSERLTLVLHDGVDADHPDLDALRSGRVHIVDDRVARVVTDDGRVVAVELASGECLAADAVVIGTRFRPRIEALGSLGVALSEHPSGLGDVVDIASTGETSVPGLYAAGNVTDPSQQVLHAAAQGSWVGSMISFSLARDDLKTIGTEAIGTEAIERPSAHQTDWDHRYRGEQMWSGNPNGSLVHEVADLDPGTALDVGAGEGGDAIWLAERGWRVTAADISRRAVDRIAQGAHERGLPVTAVQADANGRQPFPADTYDLVTAHYASIPRTADDRGIQNLLAAVAAGGTLLVVGHDLEPMRHPIDTARQSRPFDPDAYIRVDDVAASIAGSADWEIEVHEKRPRPAGHTAASHHVDDIVLRARRTT